MAPLIREPRLGHTPVRTVLDVYGHLYNGADDPPPASGFADLIVFAAGAAL
jgi:hypothetical protein